MTSGQRLVAKTGAKGRLALCLHMVWDSLFSRCGFVFAGGLWVFLPSPEGFPFPGVSSCCVWLRTRPAAPGCVSPECGVLQHPQHNRGAERWPSSRGRCRAGGFPSGALNLLRLHLRFLLDAEMTRFGFPLPGAAGGQGSGGDETRGTARGQHPCPLGGRSAALCWGLRGARC